MDTTVPPPQPVSPPRPEPPTNTTCPPFFWWNPTTPPLVTREYTIQYSVPPPQSESPISPSSQQSPIAQPHHPNESHPPSLQESPTSPPIAPPPQRVTHRPTLARTTYPSPPHPRHRCSPVYPHFIWVVVAAVVVFLAFLLSLVFLIKASNRPFNPKLKIQSITISSLEVNSFVVTPELRPIPSNVATQLSGFSVNPIYAGHAAGPIAELEDIIISKQDRTWAPILSFSGLDSEQLRTLEFERREEKLHLAFEITGFVETGFNDAFPHGYMGKVRWICEGDVSLAGNRTIILDKFC